MIKIYTENNNFNIDANKIEIYRDKKWVELKDWTIFLDDVTAFKINSEIYLANQPTILSMITDIEVYAYDVYKTEAHKTKRNVVRKSKRSYNKQLQIEELHKTSESSQLVINKRTQFKLDAISRQLKIRIVKEVIDE